MGAEHSSPKHARRRTYRNSKRARVEDADEALDRALDVMGGNDFSNIANTTFPQIRGPVSWAKLGEYSCNQIIRNLGATRSFEELRNVAESAEILSKRLQARDNVKGARTTQELRNQINLIAGLSAALMEVAQLQAGARAPTFEIASRATTIRQRWSRLKIDDNPFVLQLMEHAVARVLASNASAGIKAAFNRLLLHWLPPPPPTTSSGTRIQFDSDDEDF